MGKSEWWVLGIFLAVLIGGLIIGIQIGKATTPQVVQYTDQQIIDIIGKALDKGGYYNGDVFYDKEEIKLYDMVKKEDLKETHELILSLMDHFGLEYKKRFNIIIEKQ